MKRPEGYQDFPLYYKLTSQIDFSGILNSSESTHHAYPVFDVMKNKDNIYKNTLTGDLNTDGALLYSGEHSIKNIDSLLRIADGETVLDSDVNTINNCTTNRFMDKYTHDYIQKIDVQVVKNTTLQINDYYKDKTDNKIKNKISWEDVKNNDDTLLT